MRGLATILPATGSLLLLLLAACPGGGEARDQAGPPGEGVVVRPDLEKKAPVGEWSRSEGDHRATVTLLAANMMTLGVESKVQSSDPPLPMARRVELWRPLIEQVFAERGRLPGYTLSVGEYPELAPRLAATAAASGDWDTSTGEVREGDAASVLQSLLADGSAFPELGRLFDPLGYGLRLHSAESVMVCRLGDIDFSGPGAPPRPDLPPDARVPCGALLVFRITERPRG